MNDHATNLDRMHDIVVPQPIPWWPPAPGWYVVFAVLLCVAMFLAYRVWSRWRENAYRREALRELAGATGVSAISELLRRTALVVAPRPVVAAQVGSSWPQWLEHGAPVAMSERVRRQLERGPYDPSDSAGDVGDLKQYAAEWIKRHPRPSPPGKPPAGRSR